MTSRQALRSTQKNKDENESKEDTHQKSDTSDQLDASGDFIDPVKPNVMEKAEVIIRARAMALKGNTNTTTVIRAEAADELKKQAKLRVEEKLKAEMKRLVPIYKAFLVRYLPNLPKLKSERAIEELAKGSTGNSVAGSSSVSAAEPSLVSANEIGAAAAYTPQRSNPSSIPLLKAPST